MHDVYCCSKCGNQLADNVKFCSNCGQEVVWKKETSRPKTETDELNGTWKGFKAVIAVLIIIIVIVAVVAIVPKLLEVANAGTLSIEIKNHSDSSFVYYCYIDGEHEDVGNLFAGRNVIESYKVEGGRTHVVTVELVNAASQMKSVYVPEHGATELRFDFY